MGGAVLVKLLWVHEVPSIEMITRTVKRGPPYINIHARESVDNGQDCRNPTK